MFGVNPRFWCEYWAASHPWVNPRDFRPPNVFSMSIADLLVRWLGVWVTKPKSPFQGLRSELLFSKILLLFLSI